MMLKQDDWGAMLGEGIKSGVSKGLAQYHRFKRLAMEQELQKSRLKTDALQQRTLEEDFQRTHGGLGQQLFEKQNEADYNTANLKSLLAQEGVSPRATSARSAEVGERTAKAELGTAEAKSKMGRIPGQDKLFEATKEFELEKIKEFGKRLSTETAKLLAANPDLLKKDTGMTLEYLEMGANMKKGPRGRIVGILEYLAESGSKAAQIFVNNKEGWEKYKNADQSELGQLRGIQQRMNLDILGGGRLVEGREGEEVRGPGDLFGPRSSEETKPFPRKDALKPPKRMGSGSNLEQRSTSKQIVNYADDLVRLHGKKGPKAVRDTLARLRKSRPDLYDLVQAEMERREDAIKFKAQSLFGTKE